MAQKMLKISVKYFLNFLTLIIEFQCLVEKYAGVNNSEGSNFKDLYFHNIQFPIVFAMLLFNIIRLRVSECNDTFFAGKHLGECISLLNFIYCCYLIRYSLYRIV